MYLVTATGEESDISEGRDTLPKAKELAEQWSRCGYGDVTIWLRTHTVAIVSQANWTEHAKGLSGPNPL